MALRDPFQDVLHGPEIVAELRGVNDKLDKGFSGVNLKLDVANARLEQITQVLQEIRDEIRDQGKSGGYPSGPRG